MPKVIPTTIATTNKYLGQNITQHEPRSERNRDSESRGEISGPVCGTDGVQKKLDTSEVDRVGHGLGSDGEETSC